MKEPVATRQVVVTNPQGVHARPAEMLARLANSFAAEIEIAHGDHCVDAKSILNILTLGARPGVELTIAARGDDAEEAVNALVDLIASDFAADETMSRESSG